MLSKEQVEGINLVNVAFIKVKVKLNLRWIVKELP